MAPSTRNVLLKGYLFLFVPLLASLTASIAVDICSSFNTASMAKNVSIWQTNGLCHDFCLDSSAFAITQGNGCWCSDFYPDKSTTVDVTKCDTPCPAWPSEDCGGDGVFGYVVLNQVAPSGTKTEAVASSTSAPAKITTVTDDVTKTVQATASSSTSIPMMSTKPETSTTLSSSSSSQTTASSQTTQPPPSSTVRTVTDGGVVKTVTVVPTQTAASGDSSPDTGLPVKHSGLSKGAVIGIAVGVVLAVLAFAGSFLFWFFARRRHAHNDYRDDPSVRGSSSGMISAALPEMSMHGETPASPNSANRNSAIQVDPRMDPFKQGLYLRSSSHESLNTLRDEHDYSRRIQQPKVLRAMNPDPEER